MRRVRAKDTSCEVRFRKRLFARGLRYRLHANLPGRPDIVFPAARVAVFVDGCFWHRCAEHCRIPATNRAYWERKIARNRERDAEADAALRAMGWRPIRIWEHEVRSDAGCAKAAARVARAVRRRSAG